MPSIWESGIPVEPSTVRSSSEEILSFWSLLNSSNMVWSSWRFWWPRKWRERLVLFDIVVGLLSKVENSWRAGDLGGVNGGSKRKRKRNSVTWIQKISRHLKLRSPVKMILPRMGRGQGNSSNAASDANPANIAAQAMTDVMFDKRTCMPMHETWSLKLKRGETWGWGLSAKPELPHHWL